MANNPKNKNKVSNGAFSLIEIMVVIGIIGMLVATVYVNSGRNPDRDMRQEAERLKSFIRSVQNKALTAEKVNTTGKLCGFGIKRLSDVQFQVYYVQTVSLSSTDDCLAYVNNSGTNMDAREDFTFKNDVNISDGFSDSDKLFFLVPKGKAYWNGSDSVGLPVSIKLTKSGQSLEGAVSIDSMGKVY